MKQLNLENANTLIKTHIIKLKHNGGGEITDPDEILNAQRPFYSSLYTTPHITATDETFEQFFGGTMHSPET